MGDDATRGDGRAGGDEPIEGGAARPVSRPPVGGVVAARGVVRWLGEHRRRAAPDVLYRLYLVALVTLPVTWSVVRDPRSADDPTLAGVLDGVGTWAPLVVVAVLVTAARVATWGGVAVPERGAVRWLFTAPILPAELLRPVLRRTLLLGAAAGALVAYLPTLELVARSAGPPVPLLGAAVLGGGAVGVLAVAVCWWVQRTAARARAVARWSPGVLVVVGVAGATVARLGTPDTAVLVSGPWGWSVQPLLAAAGGDPPAAGIAAAVLAVAAVTAAVWVERSAGAVPLGELARRAEPLTGIRSAAFFGDLRAAADIRRRAHRDLVGASRRGPRPPRRRPWTAVPWMGTLVLLRSPRWIASAAGTGIVATLSAGQLRTATAIPAATLPVLVACLGGSLVASQVLDPLRAEESTLLGARWFPWTPLRTSLLHLIAPTLAAVIAVAVAAVAAVAVGAPAGAAAAGAALALLGIPVAIAAAALTATSPPIDLTTPSAIPGSAGGGVAVRLLAGPQLVLLAVGLPGLLIAAAYDRGAPLAGAVLSGSVWTALVTAACVAGLVRRFRRRDAVQ